MILTLHLLPELFAVCRLGPEAEVPAWAVGPGWWSVTRTAAELSVVCPWHRVPPGVESVGPWHAFEVDGPLAFELTGVLAVLTAPLAAAGVPIFAVSTFDTDYLLVQADQVEAAATALAAAGHRIAAPPPQELRTEETAPMAEKLISNVYVFETNPTQVAFIEQSSTTPMAYSMTGFRVGAEGEISLQLDLQEGYTYQEVPVLWLQPDGTFAPQPPVGFAVDRVSKVTVLIHDDFRESLNPGTFVFRLQLVSPVGDLLTSDPTIVNRPIENPLARKG